MIGLEKERANKEHDLSIDGGGIALKESPHTSAGELKWTKEEETVQKPKLEESLQNINFTVAYLKPILEVQTNLNVEPKISLFSKRNILYVWLPIGIVVPWFVGFYIGHNIIGGQSFSDVFRFSTWSSLFRIFFGN